MAIRSYGKCCGIASVIDNKVGRKIALSNPNRSVGEFAKVIEELEQNRSLLKEMSENCNERQLQLSWEVKTKKMITYYEQVKRHIIKHLKSQSQKRSY